MIDIVLPVGNRVAAADIVLPVGNRADLLPVDGSICSARGVPLLEVSPRLLAVMPAGPLQHEHLRRAAPTPSLPCATARAGSGIHFLSNFHYSGGARGETMVAAVFGDGQILVIVVTRAPTQNRHLFVLPYPSP